MPQGVEAPWLTCQQFSNLVGNVTDMVIAERNWQPMIDAIWENRTVEDYETTGSTVKTDFMRKWHHNRSGKAISLDEMMENEDGDIFEVADPHGEFEQNVLSKMQNSNTKRQSRYCITALSFGIDAMFAADPVRRTIPDRTTKRQ